MIFLNTTFDHLSREELIKRLVQEIKTSTGWAELFYRLQKIDEEEKLEF